MFVATVAEVFSLRENAGNTKLYVGTAKMLQSVVGKI
jgi:hypothetical protein